MAYRVALNFEDGVTRVIMVDEDEIVTDAAFQQKINLPMDCRDGVCGTCKCKCEEGAYELVGRDRAALRYGKWDLMNTYAERDGKPCISSEPTPGADPRAPKEA